MLDDISLGYSGSYERFDTVSKKEAAVLVGADNLVGDRFSIEFRTEDGVAIAWMKNKFNALIGYFNPEVSRQLQICEARGWKITALLSFVAYVDTPSPGEYWGEAAIICYNPQNNAEAFETFISTISSMMQEGIRPDVSLSSDGVSHVVEESGRWKPTARVPYPDKDYGMVILKCRRKFSEKLIEQGRAGNKGCYAISWIFIAIIAIALIAGAFFGLRSLGIL